MNPFDLSGPDFLALYSGVAVAALVGAALLRWHLRQPSDDILAEELVLDTYEVAYLSGGSERAVQAALSRLVKDDMLYAGAGERSIFCGNSPPREAHWLERAVYAATDGNEASLDEMRRRVAPAAAPMEERLQELGLLLAPSQAVLVRWLPSLLILAAVVFGGIKVLVGISRNKPVVFLFMACSLMFMFAVVALAIRPWRSRRGDRLLTRLREKNSALELAWSRDRSGRIAGPDLALAVALFGVSTLSNVTILSNLYRILKPRPGSRASGCGDVGAGCGGGCGGGGCGGGGCGGCSS